MRWLVAILLVPWMLAAAEARPVKSVPSSDLEAAAIALLQHELPESTITPVAVSAPIPLPEAAAPTLIAEALTRSRAGRVPVRIRAMIGEREVGRGLVTVQIRAFRPVLIAAMPIPRGSAVGLHQVRTERMEILPGQPEALNDPAQIAGMVAQRDLPAGAILTVAAVAVPPAIRPGPVTLIFAREDIQLTASAEATAIGRLGDLVTVRRGDGQSIRGKVVGPGQVLVNY